MSSFHWTICFPDPGKMICDVCVRVCLCVLCSVDANDFDPFDKSDLWITDDDEDEDEGTETISSENSEKGK